MRLFLFLMHNLICSQCFSVPLRSVLLQFKQSLTVVQCSFDDYPSAYSNVTSWNQEEENSDCCLWDGIKCKEDTGHVIRLDLTSSCPYGSINSSSSLFQLVRLEWFVLSNNHFNFSEIPSEIKNLSRLTALSLSLSLSLILRFLVKFQPRELVGES